MHGRLSPYTEISENHKLLENNFEKYLPLIAQHYNSQQILTKEILHAIPEFYLFDQQGKSKNFRKYSIGNLKENL
ncbi:MAG: hypothetical protein U5K00_05025 [Melioribacteraceae bacterium]|nr:hypothetical protein [Melioribacteraceae bacterium]